jgi:DNA polymerase-3 subunit alpha
MFDKQISVRGEDGVKHVVEKSWFNRGNMIVVNGMRSGDDFVSKKYASTSGHQLYRIERVNDDGTLVLKDHRYQGGIEEEDV